MPTFTPPTVSDIPPILPETTGQAARLYRYFPNHARYVSVFKLSDGTYVQDTGTAQNNNTNVPYPWDPNMPGAPYSSTSYYDYTAGKMVIDDIAHSVWITTLYQGPTYVSSTEAAALTSAGYGANIT